LLDLERALGREVRLARGANCFAVSVTDGAAKGCAIVFGVSSAPAWAAAS
jgi:hypothetical protein